MATHQTLLTVAAILYFTGSCLGTINMQGCTSAYISMSCPDDDLIDVHDVRLSEVEEGHPCSQELPPHQWTIPHHLMEHCGSDNDTDKGHMCMYVEGICMGKSDCTFYVSPHMLDKEQTPNINSEVIITYGCKAGPKRKGEIGIAAFVATLGMVSILTVGGLLTWRILTQDQSTYADFGGRPPHIPTSSSGSNYGTHAGGSENHGTSIPSTSASVSNFEEISVELRAPSSGNPEV